MAETDRQVRPRPPKSERSINHTLTGRQIPIQQESASRWSNEPVSKFETSSFA